MTHTFVVMVAKLMLNNSNNKVNIYHLDEIIKMTL
jgi:hypothetical protein